MWEFIEDSGILGFGIFLSQLLLIVVPVIPYIPQYLEIRQTRDASGFSLYVCLGMITSACIRIGYWMGRHYDTALFIQNFVIITVLLVMIDKCISIENIRTYTADTARNFTDFNITEFWNWTNIVSYIQATVLFTVVMIIVASIFHWVPGALMCFGVTALLIDTLLTMPQFLQNWLNKTTFGMNKSMVALWILGDILKLLYFTLRDVPFSFVLCVVLQLLMDCAVLWQVFKYGDAPVVPRVYDLRDLPQPN